MRENEIEDIVETRREGGRCHVELETWLGHWWWTLCNQAHCNSTAVRIPQRSVPFARDGKLRHLKTKD